jgi:hypothetical protein
LTAGVAQNHRHAGALLEQVEVASMHTVDIPLPKGAFKTQLSWALPQPTLCINSQQKKKDISKQYQNNPPNKRENQSN